MDLPRMRRAVRRGPLAVLVAVAAAAVFVLSQLPAGAITVTGTPAPVTGNATYFDGLGQPYGGCGMPQANLDSQDFVALNVFNTPGDYSFSTRPVPASMADKIGMWDNGLNCGRYVQVTIGDYCTGTNDGAPSQPFCRNGSPVGDLYPTHWNNRHITWQFVNAPNYTGDIQIGFLQGAQPWWPAIAVSHLPGGIHGVEYFAQGAWRSAQMDGDMGQAYIIGGTTSGGSQFQIRVRDASDTLINNGRAYSFTLPAGCSPQCGAPYTQTAYTTSGGPTTSPTPTPTASPTPTATPTVTASPTPSSTSQQPGSCALSATVDSSWPGGYQLTFTVKNNGTVPSTGWTARFTFGGAQTVGSSWNASVSQSGQQVTATNVGYNGAVPPGGSTTFGMLVNGASQAPASPSCTLG